MMWPFNSKQNQFKRSSYKLIFKVSELCRHSISTLQSHNKSPRPEKSTAYVDGLRGIAALCIYIEHFTIIIFPYVRYGYNGSASRASLLQLPVVRIIFAGTSMVNIFFILTGYVLSLKPYTHASNQSYERALSSISSTLFRRAHRLYYPGLVSTFLVMLAVSVHVFDVSADFPVKPLRPLQQANLWPQYVDWCDFIWKFLANVWGTGGGSTHIKSNYGAHLWTLPALFRCSVIALMSLVALCRLRLMPNMVLTAMLGCFCMLWDMDQTALALYGTALARIHVEYSDRKGRRNNILRSFFFYPLLICGMYIASLPEFHNTATSVVGFPAFMFDLRFGLCYTLGAILIVSSISNLLGVQNLLSRSIPQYLGKISYSLYIVHEPLLQMFGWSFTDSIRQATEELNWIIQVCAIGLCWISVTVIIISVAHCFWRVVELPSVTYAKWIEDSLLEQRDVTAGYIYDLNVPSDMHSHNRDHIISIDNDRFPTVKAMRRLGLGEWTRLLIATAPFLVTLPGIAINQLHSLRS